MSEQKQNEDEVATITRDAPNQINPGSNETTNLPISPSDRMVASAVQHIPQPAGTGPHHFNINQSRNSFIHPGSVGEVVGVGAAQLQPPLQIQPQNPPSTSMLPPDTLPNHTLHLQQPPGSIHQLHAPPGPTNTVPDTQNYYIDNSGANIYQPPSNIGVDLLSPQNIVVEKVYSEGSSVHEQSVGLPIGDCLQPLGQMPVNVQPGPMHMGAPEASPQTSTMLINEMSDPASACPDKNMRNPPPAGTKRPGPAPERATRLPVSRIKTMMKFDPDVNIIAQEAAYLVAKSSEQFIEVLAKKAYANTQSEKRKTMKFKDCEAAIAEDPRFCFLDGIDLNH